MRLAPRRSLGSAFLNHDSKTRTRRRLTALWLSNKPSGRTSHDVVDAVRRLLGFRQIGHLGTLDPLATGVLVLLLGRATRFAQFYSGRRKRYDSTFRFGFATDTYDSDGTALGPDTSPALDREQIERLARSFTGRFPQMPPAFSAKKIHGRPAHELARKHKPVELKPVDVEVFDFRLLEMEGSLARFAIECGAGTYVRSLAYEMGAQLGCGAHLAEITRTAVGEFTLDRAIGLDDLEQAVRAGKAADWILPLGRLLSELPRVSRLARRRKARASRFHLSGVAGANPAGPRGNAARALRHSSTRPTGSRDGCECSTNKISSSLSPKPLFRAPTSRYLCSTQQYRCELPEARLRFLSWGLRRGWRSWRLVSRCSAARELGGCSPGCAGRRRGGHRRRCRRYRGAGAPGVSRRGRRSLSRRLFPARLCRGLVRQPEPAAVLQAQAAHPADQAEVARRRARLREARSSLGRVQHRLFGRSARAIAFAAA